MSYIVKGSKGYITRTAFEIVYFTHTKKNAIRFASKSSAKFYASIIKHGRIIESSSASSD